VTVTCNYDEEINRLTSGSTSELSLTYTAESSKCELKLEFIF